MPTEHSIVTRRYSKSTLKRFQKQFPQTTVQKNKLVAAEEAVRTIRDGDTVVFGGFVGIGAAEEVLVELEQYYLRTGHPRDLTLMFTVAVGPGDMSDRGLNR